MMIKVLIADDHAIVRKGLKQILQEHPDIKSGEADGGLEALRQVKQGPWDVLVLDIAMEDRNGIEVLKQIKKEGLHVSVLILSMYPEAHYAVRAFKAGAFGYLGKQSDPDLLVEAIRRVAAGRKYISAGLAEQLAASIGDDVDRVPHDLLSDREYQTLCLIASGRTLTEVSRHLNLSVKTVSVYRSRILEKMNLKNSAEITAYAVRHGLVE